MQLRAEIHCKKQKEWKLPMYYVFAFTCENVSLYTYIFVKYHNYTYIILCTASEGINYLVFAHLQTQPHPVENVT